MFLGSRWQIHLERFRKQPATLFFKRPTIASLIRKTQITNLNNKWKMKITNLVTTNLTYSSNAFIGLFYCRFLLPWRHLLLSFILLLLRISFLRFRRVIARHCKKNSLEINVKPATRDKNRFIIDVGRVLHPSLLSTEPNFHKGDLHASVSSPEGYLKDFEWILRTTIIWVDLITQSLPTLGNKTLILLCNDDFPK